MPDVVKVPFFPGQKRAITIDEWKPKMNRENEKRILLLFAMSITDQKIVGLPAFLTEALAAMQVEASTVDEISFTEELENSTIEFFDQDTGKAQRTKYFTGATLRGFTLKRVAGKEGEPNTIVLHFNSTVPSGKPIVTWAFEIQRQLIYMQVSESQLRFQDKQMELAEDEDPATVRASAVKQLTDEDRASLERKRNKGVN